MSHKEHANALDSAKEISFAVVGLARNCASTLAADVQRIEAAIEGVGATRWFVVESDSSDATVEVLQRLSDDIPFLRFASLGALQTRFPNRTERLAFCRNHYLDVLRSNPDFMVVDYVVVADFDGLNVKINDKAMTSSWVRDDWDMCAANQDGPYYDVWALRHKYWNPSDCWGHVKFLNRFRDNHYRNLKEAVYSKMLTIPSDSPWIEVDSAFGGLAIYKRSSIGRARYSGRDTSGELVCEHVPFHESMKSNGARLYINPRLINAGYTEHSSALRFGPTLMRNIRMVTLDFVTLILGRNAISKIRQVIPKRSK